MVKHNLTGANYGIFTWAFQKISAALMLIIAIALLLIAGLICFGFANSGVTLQVMFNYFWLKFLLQVFFSAIIINAWVSVRDIWMDYVKCSKLKICLHVLTTLWLLACLIYSIKVIW